MVGWVVVNRGIRSERTKGGQTMARRAALWLILHGAIVMLIGMFVGFPGFFIARPILWTICRLFLPAISPDSACHWYLDDRDRGRTAALSLSDRSASALVWSLWSAPTRSY